MMLGVKVLGLDWRTWMCSKILDVKGQNTQNTPVKCQDGSLNLALVLEKWETPIYWEPGLCMATQGGSVQICILLPFPLACSPHPHFLCPGRTEHTQSAQAARRVKGAGGNQLPARRRPFLFPFPHMYTCSMAQRRIQPTSSSAEGWGFPGFSGVTEKVSPLASHPPKGGKKKTQHISPLSSSALCIIDAYACALAGSGVCVAFVVPTKNKNTINKPNPTTIRRAEDWRLISLSLI